MSLIVLRLDISYIEHQQVVSSIKGISSLLMALSACSCIFGVPAVIFQLCRFSFKLGPRPCAEFKCPLFSSRLGRATANSYTRTVHTAQTAVTQILSRFMDLEFRALRIGLRGCASRRTVHSLQAAYPSSNMSSMRIG